MYTKNAKKMVWMLVLLSALASCSKNRVKCTGESEKTYAVAAFSKVNASENFHVHITNGNTATIKVKGCTENIRDLDVAVGAGGVLTVKYGTVGMVHDEPLDVFITMPQLVLLNASAAAQVQVSGFENQASYLRLVLSGAAEATVAGTPTEVTFLLSGASKLVVTGTTANLVGELNGAAYLDAYGLASLRTELDASGASKAHVRAQDKLYVTASGASEVRYKGNPPQIFTEVSGAAKVIKE
jgi:hypothetical protein